MKSDPRKVVIKEINKIITYSDRATGLRLKARVYDRNNQATTEFKPLGEVAKFIDEFQVNPDHGHLLQIEGTEYGSTQYWSFYGFSVDFTADRPFSK